MLNRAFKRKNKIAPPVPPRDLEEIQKEYAKLSSQFAAVEYQVKVYADEGKRLYGLMRVLNDEAHERQKLNAAPVEEPKDTANE